MRDADKGAVELALQGVWEYWDVSRVLLCLYTVYRKRETPYVYFHDKAPSREFHWDAYHFTAWVYAELNKLVIVRYLMKDGKDVHGRVDGLVIFYFFKE